MNRIALSFLAGAASVGITAFVTDPRPSSFGFALGILTALATVAALIGSAKGARRVARFLNIVADGLTGSRSTLLTSSKPSTTAEIPGPVERDVISALQNYGMPRKAAVQLAHDTVTANPEADFDEAMRAALSSSRKAAVR
jgi:hypothetical protein